MSRRRTDFSQFGTQRAARGGPFAQSWWGRALVSSMEKIADSGRIARGRGSARAGQVISYRIAPGAVVGEVQGSQIDPFTATFTLRPLDPDTVDVLIDRVRSTPGMLATLASGTVPIELGDLLLPTESGELDFGCTCPDQGWPCKHAAAVVYLTAQRLDTEPLVILTLRGLDLDTLIRSFDSEGRTRSPRPISTTTSGTGSSCRRCRGSNSGPRRTISPRSRCARRCARAGWRSRWWPPRSAN
ncbi:SWIM zinc finger family protein [Rhodococcus sp. MTM3W5.2]|nr:SWIM zinc finger family protein [Rhodococcus sp. MTM3W5.2]